MRNESGSRLSEAEDGYQGRKIAGCAKCHLTLHTDGLETDIVRFRLLYLHGPDAPSPRLCPQQPCIPCHAYGLGRAHPGEVRVVLVDEHVAFDPRHH